MKKTIIAFWNNEFLKGGAIFTIISFLGSVLNYFFNILAARGLGPVGFGDITALFSYMTIFSVPMLVMSLVIIQKIGSKGELSKKFSLELEEWFLSKLAKWWILIIPFALISPLIPRLTNLTAIGSYFLIPLTFLSFAGAFYAAVLQGLKFFIWMSAINLLTTVLKLLGAVFVFVFVGIDGLLIIMIFLFISALVAIFAPHIVIRKNVAPEKNHVTDKLNKRLLHAVFNQQVIVTSLSILAITILNNVDIIFVKKFFSATEAGIYSSWSLFAKIILYITGPMTTVSYIFFASKATEKNHQKVLMASFSLLFIIAIVSFLFYRYSSFFVIYIFFGKKFNTVAPYLASASIFGSLYTAITFINNYFLSRKSLFSLVILFFIPAYAIVLYLFGTNISRVITVNVVFSGLIFIVYLLCLFYYNMQPWRSRKILTS